MSALCIAGSLGDIKENLYIKGSENYVFLGKITIIPSFQPIRLEVPMLFYFKIRLSI